MPELYKEQITKLRREIEELEGLTATFSRTDALCILDQLVAVMEERERLYAELATLGWR